MLLLTVYIHYNLYMDSIQIDVVSFTTTLSVINYRVLINLSCWPQIMRAGMVMFINYRVLPYRAGPI